MLKVIYIIPNHWQIFVSTIKKTFHLCMCESMHTVQYAHVDAYSCVWRQGAALSVILHHSLPYLSRQRLPLNLEPIGKRGGLLWNWKWIQLKSEFLGSRSIFCFLKISKQLLVLIHSYKLSRSDSHFSPRAHGTERPMRKSTFSQVPSRRWL